MSKTQITLNDVKEFVDAAHRDLETVKQLLAAKPDLLLRANGNETAMGAACQMKRREIIEFLLEQGVPLDLYSACALGKTDQVAAFLDADPTLVNASYKASHNKKPVTFATEHPD
ncbi:MAG: Ankyrin, partial [Chthonomonadales bacterium]|nr:Ankyrin [Chthonomonadales bacterium]